VNAQKAMLELSRQYEGFEEGDEVRLCNFFRWLSEYVNPTATINHVQLEAVKQDVIEDNFDLLSIATYINTCHE